MRKVNYKEKGITLIALVVTIIILLILAGVTLTTALSQNGLFQRAKIVVEKYKEAESDEAEKLGEIEKEIDKIIDGETPSSVIGSSEVADKLKEFQGKYVDIGLDTNDNKKVDDWEIFYVNEGRIFLISADCVPTSKLTEWSVMRNASNLFKSGVLGAHGDLCMCWDVGVSKLDLPEEEFLSLVMSDEYDLISHATYSDVCAVSQLLSEDDWNGIKEASRKEVQSFIDFVIGGPSLEMWCAAWNEAVVNDESFVTLEETVLENGYGITVNGGDAVVQRYLNRENSELSEEELGELETTYKTFFPHTSKVGGSCYGYWLASPTDYSTSRHTRLFDIQFEGNVDFSVFNEALYGVRPLICLKDGVGLIESGDGTSSFYVPEKSF